ncbi:MAG: hypothetical protein RLZZ241_1076 [Bacteroidota bacterium]|jgi:hypothetical protein
MQQIKSIAFVIILLALVGLACSERAESEDATPDIKILRSEFESPPQAAKPRVWWHWMNGNITQEGITKDLEWMEQTGIGGFQNFDANLFTPVVVDEKLVFMTPKWKDAFKHTTDLAAQKGLEMAIAGSPGWSVTGGPWVAPQDAMKKYVWSELKLTGGTTFSGKIPIPNTQTGSFQNVPEDGGIEMSGEHNALPVYYKDAAVFAVKLPDAATGLKELNPTVTSSGGHFSLDQLTDGDLHTAVDLPPGVVGEEIWIQYSFNQPQTFRSYSVVGANHNSLEQFRGSPNNRRLYVSDDGTHYTKVADIPGTLVPQITGSFPATTGRFWRFAYETLPPAPSGIEAMFGAAAPRKPDGVPVAEFNLYQTDRIDRFEDKAGFSAWREGTPNYLGTVEQPLAINEIIDLTDRVKEDGSLTWDVPSGKWELIRLGYSLTGRQNHPASPEATGLEVDKLDSAAVKRYINHYLDLYQDASGQRLGEQGLGYIILDSYEAGHMNWTGDMRKQFESRRGYSMLPWLPVLTGRVVQSREASEQFLWDFRKTIGELISDNHYDVIGAELKKRGMRRYTESHEGGRIYLADGMDVKRRADIPMSAMWTPGSLAGGGNEEVRSEGDIRESASVSNIFGKPYVAAESMTAIQNAFSWHPGKLKRTADMELASGLNRFVIHTSVHQPLDNKMPGFSLGPFGQYFTRQETWSGAGAQAWVSYLSRSSHMMQQGKNIADVLYLYGENYNVTQITQDHLPEIGKGFEFDFVSATILKEAITAADGKLHSTGGAKYELLQMDSSTSTLTLSTLQKIKEFADAGVLIKGNKPMSSPSLSDDAVTFKKLADAIWSLPNVGPEISLEVPSDFTYSGTENTILYRHRQAGDLDIYWVNNRSENPATAKLSFRVTGKRPELWDPITGTTRAVTYEIVKDRTEVQVDLSEWDAFFIVFGEKATEKRFTLPRVIKSQPTLLTGPWELKFQAERGGPEALELSQLMSWSEHPDSGVRHFSGTVTYLKSFDLMEVDTSKHFFLDLGEVHDLAEVLVNGKSLGVIWKPPFRIDMSRAVQPGTNQLEIRVTNTWVNRLIGDAHPEVTNKITFTTMPFYRETDSLLPAGLFGPVQIIQQAAQ